MRLAKKSGSFREVLFSFVVIFAVERSGPDSRDESKDTGQRLICSSELYRFQWIF